LVVQHYKKCAQLRRLFKGVYKKKTLQISKKGNMRLDMASEPYSPLNGRGSCGGSNI